MSKGASDLIEHLLEREGRDAGVDTWVPAQHHGCVSSTLPVGVVTFLFTDVEGSTKLLHELGDAYADALHGHRRPLREVFTAHEGVEVDTQLILPAMRWHAMGRAR